MNRRLVGVVAAIALAAAGTFVLVSYVRGAEERAVAGEQTVEVLVVTEAVPRGVEAADLSSRVKTVLVPAKIQASGTVATLDDLDGFVTAVDLVPGEQLLASRFVAPEVLETQTKTEIPDGLLQVTVSLSPDRAVGGQLRPGTTVAVFASFDPFTIGSEPDQSPTGAPDEGPPVESSTEVGDKTSTSTHIVLHKVLVTNVQVEKLPKEEAAGTEGTGNFELAPTGNLLVTLAVTAADAERIVFTAEHGAVWLAVEPETASELGTTIQTRGTIYR